MSNPIFNSRNKLYKSKFGAIAAGESVNFRLLIPNNGNRSCTNAWLFICKDSFEETRLELSATDDYFDNCRWWEISHSIAEPGLYWYRFQCDTSFGSCNISNDGHGIGFVTDAIHSWQLTVYSSDFKTPSWLKGGLIYQIFPDRFNKSQSKKENLIQGRILRDDWCGEPIWKPTDDGKVLNNDFFGGDLKGIEQKLSYLKNLGVTCIYLNPIFEAYSNHRYDTADYEKIDPFLGTQEDFTSLCKTAKANGIHIVLDGVFNHTGDDSKYFNKYKRYGEGGAYNSKESPYYDWYRFNNWPDDYESWWGFQTLPEVKEECPEYLNFIVGDGGIIEKWLKAGADGWRLDVADELPDFLLDKIRARAKKTKPDSFIIGEVWEDASNKISYGFRRKYLLGDQLDSVMNYPFSKAIIDFVTSYRTDDFFDNIMSVLENYPPQVINVLMNPLGTHDTQRILTVLAGLSCEYKDRKWQSEYRITEEQKKSAMNLLTIASAIQYTLPGVPSLYYGDEAGVTGFKDPFNRTCYPWGAENAQLVKWYKFLGKLRRNCPALIDGQFVPISAALGCVAYARVKGDDTIVIIANRNDHKIDYNLTNEFSGLKIVSGCTLNGLSVQIPSTTCAILGKGSWI
ncbi:MAG: glycoside hydrolase family 13 protein [Clostridia bacterium]|nr:glycoside hydrolase family 13 protein [Clostridia bacterium]